MHVYVKQKRKGHTRIKCVPNWPSLGHIRVRIPCFLNVTPDGHLSGPGALMAGPIFALISESATLAVASYSENIPCTEKSAFRTLLRVHLPHRWKTISFFLAVSLINAGLIN